MNKKAINNSEYIVELKDLTKAYGDKVVVDSINLKIKKGDFVTFLGPSGCGKTTTLRMIAGFEMSTSGSVLFNGVNIAGMPPHKREVNTVFQKYALFPHLNVYNNIAFGLKLKKEEIEVTDRKGQKVTKLVNIKNKPTEQLITKKDGSQVVKIVKFKNSTKTIQVKEKNGTITTKTVNCYKHYIDEKVKKALKIVGLSDYELRDVNSLSGGQQQRVAIARAIVNEPQILLLDEPLGALDLKMRQEMQLELKSMHKTLGITFIYVTHDQEEALTMSDSIVIMRDGKICQEGTPIDIYNEPKSAYVADFIGESNILDGVMPQDKKVFFAGTEWECIDTGFAPNQLVDVVVRPEDWSVKAKDKGMINGVITSSFFRGVHYEMVCKANGYELIIHSTAEKPIGKEVSLSVDPSDIHIMEKESYRNECEIEFASNNTFYMYGGLYDFDPTKMFDNASYDTENDELVIDNESTWLKGKKAIISFEFTDVDLTDNEFDAPLSGNVESLIYKGKNYLVTVKTDDNHHIIGDTEYLWDDGDRVGIDITEEDFRLVRML